MDLPNGRTKDRLTDLHLNVDATQVSTLVHKETWLLPIKRD